MLDIWTHISALKSKDYYHVYQDWRWSRNRKTKPRRYSFLGLYRKYSETDLNELMRLKEMIFEQKAIRQVDDYSLFASFQGYTIFTIFFKEVKVLNRILSNLEIEDFPKQHDDDDNELENEFYRRLYFTLSKHELDVA